MYLSPGIHAAIFFSQFSFVSRVYNGLSDRGTTRSLFHRGLFGIMRARGRRFFQLVTDFKIDVFALRSFLYSETLLLMGNTASLITKMLVYHESHNHAMNYLVIT